MALIMVDQILFGPGNPLLEGHSSQLQEYVSVAHARVAVADEILVLELIDFPELLVIMS
jgi:hypothetical protein